MMRSFADMARRVAGMRKSLRDGAGELLALSAEGAAQAAKRHAPVDTGALKRSIDFEMQDPSEARVYADMPYAAQVEYGTSRMAAQPFMQPAAEEQRGHIARDARRIFGKGGRI